MKQITEDYVSYEIAKLLKEKGFNGECISYFSIYKDNNTSLHRWRNRQTYVNVKNDGYTIVPTHQMALKWLREVHNQIIIIKYGNVGFAEESILQWWWELINTKGELHACNIVDGNKSYEEACEDSILYVLKNLI